MARPIRHLGVSRHLVVLLLALCVVFALPARAHAFGYEPRQALINKAIDQLGKSYVWAAAGPNSFDCSGLTLYAYQAAGIKLPHQSGMIWSMCDTVTAGRLEPGDLVFRARLPSGTVEPTSSASIYHVGIYVGGGRVFEASSPSKPIGYSSLSSFKLFGRLKEKYWPQGDRSYDAPPLARGDFTGDGREDAAWVVKTGPTSIRILVAASTATTMAPAKSWYTSSGSWEWDRTKVASGDFTGDGKADLALVYGYSDGSIKAWVFPSTGSGFGSKVVWWTSPAGSKKWASMKLAAGDLTGDRKADLVALYDNGNNTSSLLVGRSTGSAFSVGSWWSSGSASAWRAKETKIAVGDLTGDKKADVALLRDAGRGTGTLYALASTGSALVNKGAWYAPARNSFEWSRVKLLAPDMDGDGKADIAWLYDLGGGSSRISWAKSTGTALALPAQTWWTSVTGQWDWERTRFGVADVDKNGRADVQMLFDNFNRTSRLWTYSTASGGAPGPIRIEWYSGYGLLDWNRVR
jgi:hypothetical protein